MAVDIEINLGLVIDLCCFADQYFHNNIISTHSSHHSTVAVALLFVLVCSIFTSTSDTSNYVTNHGADSVSGAGVLAWLVRGLLCRSEHEAGGRAVLVTGCDTGIGEVMRS